MGMRWRLIAVALAGALTSISQSAGAQSPQASSPMAWIDPDTSHKVIRLTKEPGSKVLYFNENAFTNDGKEMVYWVLQDVYVINLDSRVSRRLIAGPVKELVVAKKSPSAYFQKAGDNALYVVDVASGQARKLTDLPAGASLASINSDETLGAGTITEEGHKGIADQVVDKKLPASSVRAVKMDQRLAAKVPMSLFTIDLRTGSVNKIFHSNDWLSHVQFSPTDPTLLMYCHEGLWFRVDRIWTIRTNGSHNELVHKRTMNQEIAGHEFWDNDGKTIWYDLEIPRGQNFYLANYNVETRARFWYHVERDTWSIHYNISPDGTLFCGDGGDYAQVAKTKNGQWIELFSPRKNPPIPEIDQTGLIQSGFFVSQHLVNLQAHDYKLEPNVRFTPDHKYVVFSSNMHGVDYIYAVEVMRTKVAAPGQ